MRQATRKESALERDYRRAWIKLLTQVAQAPRQIDEFFSVLTMIETKEA